METTKHDNSHGGSGAPTLANAARAGLAFAKQRMHIERCRVRQKKERHRSVVLWGASALGFRLSGAT